MVKAGNNPLFVVFYNGYWFILVLHLKKNEKSIKQI